MDYRELIEYLRTTAACGNYCYNCQRCMDAADAIETLLADRKALIKELSQQCGIPVNQSLESQEIKTAP